MEYLCTPIKRKLKMYNGVNAFFSMSLPIQLIVGFIFFSIINLFTRGMIGSLLGEVFILTKRLIVFICKMLFIIIGRITKSRSNKNTIK